MTSRARPAKEVTPRGCGCGGEALGLADDGDDQVLALEQALGRALGVGERHRLDLGVAPVDVVGAQVLLPEAQQLVGDLGVAVEAQREGAGQVVLGVPSSFSVGPSAAMRLSSARIRSSDWAISSFLVATPPENTEVCL